MNRYTLKKMLLTALSLLILNQVNADTAVSLFDSYAGNINFVGTEATRRTQSNSGNSCAVMSKNTTNTATISGIPNGATITAAHLYWAGSYSTQSGSTRTSADYQVRFEGSNVNAASDRRYTANYSISTLDLDFFSGVADVTALVNARGNPNGSYNFSKLSVNTATQHCSTSSVLAGWSLVIVYDHSSEDFRVVNLFEGFEAFRGKSITLTPSNFVIPSSPINGKLAHISWEGDSGNSAIFGGFSERLSLNGTTLSDASNPANNQFNSTSTILSMLPSTSATDSASYGVDFDGYSITSLLSAGDTSATTTYSSGGDLVLLSSEIISVTNTPVSDLSITKTHSGNFKVGQTGDFLLTVTNNGPNTDSGPLVITDTLPTGLSFVSGSGSGWSCSAVGQVVTCTSAGSLAVGASTSPVTLTVDVTAPAFPSVNNTASVLGNNFDNISGNSSSSDTVTVTAAPNISLQKVTAILFDPVNGASNPKAIPGALNEYTLTAVNSGLSAADNNSIVISDAVPANTALVVNDIVSGEGPLQFIDGSPSSGLSYSFISLASTTDGLSFSDDGGTSYTYTPSADADGVDTSVTHFRASTQGQFLAPSGSGNPSFQYKFRIRVQ